MTAAPDLTFDIRGRDKTQAAFDSARRNARGFRQEVDQATRGMNLATMAARAFVAGLSITTVQSFGRVLRETVRSAADLVDLSDKVGVATADLQRMQFGFSLAGVEAGSIDQILTQWGKRIAEANSQGGRLADILAANKVSLTDSEGRLRSSVELMRDYADLIKNAGSDQERMDLAMQAFGKSGGDMVVALKDGAAGMDALMGKIDEAGGVLEEELLRRAAELDHEFDMMWKNFETWGKTAILNVALNLSDLSNQFGDIGAAFKDLINDPSWRNLNRFLMGDEATEMLSPTPRAGLKGRPGIADARIAAEQAAWNRMNTLPQLLLPNLPDERTIIPTKDDSDKRKKSAAAAKEQETAYQRVTAALEHERQLISLSEIDQRILNEQRRAGVSAASAEGQAIADKVRRIEEEREAMQRLEDAQQAFNDSVEYLGMSGFETMWSIATGAEDAEEAIKKLGLEILKAAAYALLFNQGPLAGLFGGGLFGGGGGGFSLHNLPGNANGTDNWRGGLTWVGERGKELVNLPRGSQVIPNHELGGGSGGGTQINIIDQAGVKKRTERSRGPTGQEMVTVVLERVKEEMATGGFDSANRRFGARPVKVSRG